jgi:cytochrome c-type biogenesis protein CcmE
MKPRQQRMLAVGLAALGIAIAAGLTLRAFQDNMMFFVEVSDEREEGSIDVRFDVTDTACTIPVAYSGVLPDLFREGQGVVAHGRMGGDNVFQADKILAKHDEEYMAPEVAESLSKHQKDIVKAVAAGAAECNSNDS